MQGAGKSTGETTELVNSYLSRLGPVTRNSCKAGQSCVNIVEISSHGLYISYFFVCHLRFSDGSHVFWQKSEGLMVYTC